MKLPMSSLLCISVTCGVAAANGLYPIVDTGQEKFYDNWREIPAPLPGTTFSGQDARQRRHPASYALSPDGLTIRDNVTGLTWQRSPDTDGDGAVTSRDKLTLSQAMSLPAKLNARRFGGFNDWRLPSIKELYSLFDARGIDPSGPMDLDTSSLRPFIDTRFFQFAYGDPRAGERIIDSQWATCSTYVGFSVGGKGKMFGVNFADGRIKGYDLMLPGRGEEKTFFVLCVRGNPSYGKNDFQVNGNGTITDRATGLMWSKSDSGRALDWAEALSWVREQNAAKRFGYADWRLPSIKELQSLVDYGRAPDATQSPAISPVFDCTAITNEIGQVDYPFYWSGTTHVGMRGGSEAAYIAFGRAAGWMRPPNGGGPPRPRPMPEENPDPSSPGNAASQNYGAGGWPMAPPAPPPPEMGSPDFARGRPHYLDVHGAGAQRSDPKSGDPLDFPHGRGPQGDIVRIYNYARLVRSLGD